MSLHKFSLGLRIDVDTFRGTREGVPRLLKLLKQHGIRASFFFSVGPDNMGRHVWRLYKPAFLLKMLRSKANSLYGWDILLRGTLWPGPMIGQKLADIIRDTELAGHEVGLHGWDHHRWQRRMAKMSRAEIRHDIEQGMDTLSAILQRRVNCSAVPGWQCNDAVVLEKNGYWFRYNSDCRGRRIFTPVIDGVVCTPQIPVTLPTYDEMIGCHGVIDANYNEVLLSMLNPDELNVLAIHAEVEGIARSGLFAEFVQRARQQGVRFLPLGELLPVQAQIPCGSIVAGPVPGREGDVCKQS